ncbi:MAG: spore coat associated protein CotJA [Acutalibacteraceae bacterium]
MTYCNSQPYKTPSCCDTKNQKSDTVTCSCNCERSALPSCPQVAMAYVPFQQSSEVYPAETGICKGTMFPCLDLPFMRGCCK